MALPRPRVLQYGKMPLPQLDAELAQAYDVQILSEQADPQRFLAEQGAQFEYAVTSAAMGLPARVVDALPALKFVSSFGVGFDALDKDALLRRGARVGYTPGVLDDCVADMAFALLLDSARGVSAADRFVRRGDWSRQRFGITTRVSGKRLGIFGMGRIGSTVARRAQGFDMQVGYHNRRPVEDAPHRYLDSLLELARWCDFLVITAAGGDNTRHLVNAEVLDALGPQGFVVNVARGSVVDEAALAEALRWPRRCAAAASRVRASMCSRTSRARTPICWRWRTWCLRRTWPAARMRPAAPWPTWCCRTCSSSSPPGVPRPKCPGPPHADRRRARCGAPAFLPFPRRLHMNRRKLLKTFSASAVGAWSAAAGAQSFGFTPQQRYPDPSVYILDPSFAKYRIYSSTVEQLGTGMRWAEGPAYFPETGTLILSDIPNNRLMKYEEKTGRFSVHKENANYANGNARDRQGRLITCEHSVTRRVVRTERDGSTTVLAERYQGKRLNAPNDVVVRSDDSIWFTDPLFGINGEWEGARATPEQPGTFVYRIGKDGQISAVITDLVNPNGLAFSPDEKKLYVVEWKGNPNRGVWSFDVSADGTSLSNKTRLIDADGPGAFDGLRVDRDGNLWCGWGFSGAFSPEASDIGGGMRAHLPLGKSEEMDGVKIFNSSGKPIGFIRLPERCANLEFGGPKRNRLYMASSHSLYALYVEAHGAA